MIRAAIRADLERRRALNIEARGLRARLDQLAAERSALSMAMIALKHGVSLGVVQAIAGEMTWTDDEKHGLQINAP